MKFRICKRSNCFKVVKQKGRLYCLDCGIGYRGTCDICGKQCATYSKCCRTCLLNIQKYGDPFPFTYSNQRKCLYCNVLKTTNDFYAGKSKCKECICNEQKFRYKIDKDFREQKKDYRKNNQHKYNLRSKERYKTDENYRDKKIDKAYGYGKRKIKGANRSELIDGDTLCYLCDEFYAVDLHHIVPLSTGGSGDWTNLAPLCKQCHFLVHRKEVWDRLSAKYNILLHWKERIFYISVIQGVFEQFRQDALSADLRWYP